MAHGGGFYSREGEHVNVNVKTYKKDKIKLYNRSKSVSRFKKCFISFGSVNKTLKILYVNQNLLVYNI